MPLVPVIVKFFDDVELPYIDGLEADPVIAPLWASNPLFGGLTIYRHVALEPGVLDTLVEKAKQTTPSYKPYGFTRTFFIPCDTDTAPAVIAALLAAPWSALVEAAYVFPDAVPSGVNPEQNPDFKKQTYLKPAAEGGIGITEVWALDGADGEGRMVGVVDSGWLPTHQEFDPARFEHVFGANPAAVGPANHGTGTLGVLFSRDDTHPIVGIVPHVKKVHLALYGASGDKTLIPVLQAIAQVVLAWMKEGYPEGYVVLLEAHVRLDTNFGPLHLPVEAVWVARDWIKFMIAMNITVVEPAGNEAWNLDDLSKNGYHFTPGTPQYIDSGAIMVGACHSKDRSRHKQTPNGHRINCFAWGEDVYTAAVDPANPARTDFYANYSGTSSASAIVAGAAIALQGIAKKKTGSVLPALVLRTLLSDPNLNTPSKQPDADLIGVMPNLPALAQAILKNDVTLLTKSLSFILVFPGTPAYDNLSFKVTGWATLKVENFAELAAAGLTVFPLGNPVIQTPPAFPEFWFQYVPTDLSKLPAEGTLKVRVRWIETGQIFEVPVEFLVESLPYASTVLVLDQSGSMSLAAGATGLTRIQALQAAAQVFITLTPNEVPANPATGQQFYHGNYLGIVGFSSDAYPARPLTYLDAGFAATNDLAQLAEQFPVKPDGMTAIGLGLQQAASMLAEHVPEQPGYLKSILVFTDGIENLPPKIAEVAPEIGEHVYAVGLGDPQQISTAALTQLTANTGGYCLITGPLGQDTPDLFRLSKYFIQVLCDLTSTQVAFDPEGVVSPGEVVRIPFHVSEADYGLEVVLLADGEGLGLALETPDGKTVNDAAPGVVFLNRGPVRCCRLGLPLLGPRPVREGTWYACVTGLPPESARAAERRYSVNVHVRSGLKLGSSLAQRDFLPGSPLQLRCVLDEDGRTVAEASCVAHVTGPGGRRAEVAFQPRGSGVYETLIPTAAPGVYTVRMVVSGTTRRGHAFTREKTLTGTVWPTGQDAGGTRSPAHGRHPWWWLIVVSVLLVLLALVVVLFILAGDG